MLREPALDQDFPFAAGNLPAAAVLCYTEWGNLHIGVLYMDGSPKILHLGWQDYLSADWPWLRLWAAPSTEAENLMRTAGYCRRIWKRFQQNRTFPYALGDFGADFDEQGALRLPPGSVGLTCATFVLAVFRAAEIDLVSEEGWPIRPEEDLLFLESIRHFARPEHFALLQAQVDQGVARVHPQEVLGACTLETIPANFDAVRGAAEGVVRKLGPPQAS